MRPGNRREQQPEQFDDHQRAELFGRTSTHCAPGEYGKYCSDSDPDHYHRAVAGVVAEDPADTTPPGLVEDRADRSDPVGLEDQIGEVVTSLIADDQH